MLPPQPCPPAIEDLHSPGSAAVSMRVIAGASVAALASALFSDILYTPFDGLDPKDGTLRDHGFEVFTAKGDSGWSKRQADVEEASCTALIFTDSSLSLCRRCLI